MGGVIMTDTTYDYGKCRKKKKCSFDDSLLFFFLLLVVLFCNCDNGRC